MTRVLAAAIAVVAMLVLPGVAAAKPQRDIQVQLLAINDLHGHLSPNTPGAIQVGCCDPVLTSGVQTGWTQKVVPAGGIAFLATHIKTLRKAQPEHDHRRRWRSDRREPARLGALP